MEGQADLAGLEVLDRGDLQRSEANPAQDDRRGPSAR
jgi:hypothetical protein